MKRTVGLSLLIIASLGWVAILDQIASEEASAEENETRRHRAEMRIDGHSQFPHVLLHVVVENEAGQPIESLAPGDFMAKEDGIAVELQQPDAGGAVRAVLVIDRSNSMIVQRKIVAAREAAEVFVSSMPEGRDKTALVLFSSEVETLGPLTDDRDRLITQIGSIEPEGRTAFHDAVHAALDILEPENGKRVIVALTDGADNSSVRGFVDAIARANEQGIPIHTIGLGYEVSELELSQLATATGGQLHVRPPLESLPEIYRRLMRSVQNEHLLIYKSPTPRLDGTRRRVVVDAQVPDGALQLSDSYTVASLLTPGNPGQFKLIPPLVLGALILIPSLSRRRRKPSTD